MLPSSGKTGSDVKFLLTYDNIVMRGESEDDKVACLFAYLDVDAYFSYRSYLMFAWSLIKEGPN